MNKALQFDSGSEAQTEDLAASLARILRAGDVVALEGPMGSGKTCFVRGMVQGLGLDQSLVSSPTFVICQEYAAPPDSNAAHTASASKTPLVHIDAYRLAGPAELESIGWEELLAAADSIIAIEWPSRIEMALPPDRFTITLAPMDEHSRSITITGSENVQRRLHQLTAQRQSVNPQKAACPTCGRPINPGELNFPFCSSRCRMADLGRWFDEDYRVSRRAEADEELES